MFQPLLDAFIESAPIKEIASKSPPLKIAVANWWEMKRLKNLKRALCISS